ncbi:hydroxylamine reductase [Desulfovibrio litoralis]|uniref:Hydroxylamine reductase n=1 Tax=Desulfovibrio litoralis DSM 11393 TaxID=1121455 RepID=A0A1M7SET4_9BACT|nr:hydroxylamine reductase [Desulfovibrio litoralis]SHN56970.1 hydroxylamine reductase [Desulfovibrio litoralis DSM 11393]
MFCNQCEQTARGIACNKAGVCGKTDEVATTQDLIVYALRGLALVALEARKKQIVDKETDRLTVKALFSTLTNVNFDNDALVALLKEVISARKELMKKISMPASSPLLNFELAGSEQALQEQAKLASIETLVNDQDCNSLAQTLLFGLKGVAAYADHAAILEKEDPELYADIYRGLSFGFDGKTPSLTEWIDAVLNCGKANLRAMELLDAANTETYGQPVPTEVSLAPIEGKAILVSGHDLKDLYDLLNQTAGKGINIYTHGEMLPTHAYPKLKQFPHLVGHFGTAWQNQAKEFPNFPGAILFTTNCIQRPAEEYAKNVFTTGLVGYPGVTHVKNGDFSKVIEHALSLKGFTKEDIAKYPQKKILVGFGHNTVLGVADKVIDGVKSGAIKHFFLVGGCDGAKPGRNYYTEFVEKTPKDTIILTLACGKFRFFDKQLGDIGGIPRLLDVGQCNDAFGAVKIALALADAFKCGVNELPLTLVLSWYEQKAVAILLTLLSLGIKGIYLGPSLPAFLSPAVLDTLVKTFDIKPISTPGEDLNTILNKK